MTGESFTKKRLELTITLGTGTFGAQVGSTVTLADLRMFADISSPCGESMGALHLRMHGLTQSMMNQLTVIGPINQVKEKNKVLLSAGDANSMPTVFNGTIYTAWADYSSAPDIPFNIIAYSGLELLIKSAGVSNYPESADVSDILKKITDDAKINFINDGKVSVKLANPYYKGTALQQIRTCARDAKINYKIENNTLTIWKKGSAISSAEIQLIAPETGMVGYPALSSQGMTVKTEFTPKIILGGAIQVKSSILKKSNFIVFNYVHNLSSEAPGGPWFTTIDCYPQNI